MSIPAKGTTLNRRLWDRLHDDPDGRALAFYEYRKATSAAWKSYSEILAEAAGTARALDDHGCAPGDVCVIVLPSGPASARLVLACLIQGSIPLLIAPPSILGSGSDLEHVLESAVARTDASLVICPSSLADEGDLLRESRSRVVYGENVLTDVPPSDPSAGKDPMPDSVVALQLTSGTTGLPRICTWSHRGVLAAVDGMTAAMAVDSDDVFFNWTPLYHDMGLVNNYLTCLIAGIPLVMMSPHDFVKAPVAWLRGLTETRATTTWSPNFGFALANQRIADDQLQGVDLSGVRGFWNAAERIHLSTMWEFERRFGQVGLARDALRTNFGCAENVGGATFTEAGKPFSFEFVDREELLSSMVACPMETGSENATAIVGVGRAHPLMEISIHSDDGQTLPDGHVGEIALDTPSRMLGYWEDPKSSDQALRNGVLYTGDLGYLRDGELYWVGRSRERINVRGRKIDPSDFEPILFEIDGLRKGCFVAFGVDDPGLGTQRVVVVSEIQESPMGPTDGLREKVSRAVLERLGVSVEVMLVPPGRLTKTSSGKRRHRHFRLAYERGELQKDQVEGI